MSRKRLLKHLNPKFFLGIAHRGLWDDSLTENGLKAFGAAIAKDMAFEFDVHLSKDGQLIVCHDENLKRTTGKDGVIEDLTLAEIKKNYRLLDGEEVPTFDEVLALNQERVPFVLELKVYRKNYRPLCKAVRHTLKRIHDHRNVWVISFDPRALLSFRMPGFVRGLLVCKEHAWTWKTRGLFDTLDLEDCFVKEERVQRYRKHSLVNVWTIQKEQQFQDVLPNVDTVTFQRLDPEKVRSALAKKNS